MNEIIIGKTKKINKNRQCFYLIETFVLMRE